MFICSSDLDLDPMTPIYDFDLGILKLYLRTKNELYRSMRSKGKIITDWQTNRQTDRCGRRHYNNNNNNRSFNMVKTYAQTYKHMIHVYVYNHIQRTVCLARQK